MPWPIKGYGRVHRHEPGEMNKTEKRYSVMLEARRFDGEILWWCFEGMKFKLAKATYYTPDFVIMTATGQIEIHEIKSYWEDDARVKIKVAADKFPFVFKAFKALPKKAGGGFQEEIFAE